LLACSQRPTSCPHLEPDKSTPQYPMLLLYGLFNYYPPACAHVSKVVSALQVSGFFFFLIIIIIIIIHNPSMHFTFILITRRAHLSLATFNTSIICDSFNSLYNSLLYSICHTSPSVMGPKTSLSTFLPNAPNKLSPQFVKHQFYDTHKNTGLINVLYSMTFAFLPNRPDLQCFSIP